MNKLSQFGIIASILLIGQIIQNYFSLPIPSTVIGMILLLLLLGFRLVKLSWVEGIADALLDNISILFVPAGVAIMKEYHILKNNLLAIIITVALTTIIVMVVTAYTVEALSGSKRKRRQE